MTRIQDDTWRANRLSDQISAKDQSIQRAEAFRDDTCGSLQTSNDALGQGLTNLGSGKVKGNRKGRLFDFDREHQQQEFI